MKGSRNIKPRDKVVAVALTAAAVLGTGTYLAATRHASDSVIGTVMVSQIPNAFTGLDTGRPLSPNMTLNEFETVYEKLGFMANFYLDSDSARRIPEISNPTSQAWLALTLSKELWEAHSQGDDRPLISDLYTGSVALQVFPEINSYVTDGAQGLRFDNSGNKLVAALLTIADERSATARAIALDKYDSFPLEGE